MKRNNDNFIKGVLEWLSQSIGSLIPTSFLSFHSNWLAKAAEVEWESISGCSLQVNVVKHHHSLKFQTENDTSGRTIDMIC